jgi:hypothetical protein
MLMEFRDQRAILRVAGTCVNDDAKISGLDNEGLQAHQVLAVASDKVGPEPRLGGNLCGRRLGEEVDGRVRLCAKCTCIVALTAPDWRHA